jgi:hypothetical protein
MRAQWGWKVSTSPRRIATSGAKISTWPLSGWTGAAGPGRLALGMTARAS